MLDSNEKWGLAIVLIALSPSAMTASVEPSINPELKAHTGHFQQKIYRIADNVYSAVGWNLANTIMVVGDEGVIIVDVGEAYSQSKLVAAEFRKITDKPVVAIVYTHFHPDHINGTKAFVTETEVASGAVKIYAHDTLLDNVINQGGTIGPILSMRSGYSFGLSLPPGDREHMNAGIGPVPASDLSTFIAPTNTFSDKLDITIAGIAMQMVHVPSEAPDEIAIYLPENRVMLSAECIQGPTLPNVHTIRGTKFRDPVKWFNSLDVLRSYDAEYMVPSHGQPIYGADKVEEVLRYTRDGIQFIHDQTIRHMNKGLTPDELVEVVKFPPHLEHYSPYLREYYGTVKHAVRQIYSGYLGWFQGDPVDLDPVPRVEAAQRLVRMMGGQKKVLRAARHALAENNPQWAAELATYLIRIDHADRQARLVKADAFRQLGYAQININWRNWYLSSAMELEGTLNVQGLAQAMRAAFSSPDLLKNFPPSVWLNAWTVRLDPQKSADTHMTMGFRFTDLEEDYALEIRRGIAQLHRAIPDHAVVVLNLTKPLLDLIVAGKTTLPEAIQTGQITIKGNPADMSEFVGYFDFGDDPIYLTVR